VSVYDVLYTGMSANKAWMEASAENITNINTTRTANGGPYHRQNVVMESKGGFDDFFDQKIGGGVEVKNIVHDDSEKTVFNPDHPDANVEGYVQLPAIDLAAEMTNIIMAQGGYAANVTALNAMKKANEKTHEIGKG
jgi:flagellar basal-body rod protein FlgC